MHFDIYAFTEQRTIECRSALKEGYFNERMETSEIVY